MQLVTLVWWPHSGGRWLSRSVLKNHPNILSTFFVHPWLFNTTDDALTLDITAQVHKARSLPEFGYQLKALKKSTDAGRILGLKSYYSDIADYAKNESKDSKVVLGESCLGSPNPRSIDLHALYAAQPDMKLIHLVRDPRSNLGSFVIREEMDGDPIKIAGSWYTKNYEIREFFKNKLDNYLMVRYEDLLSDLKNQLIRICDFSGLAFSEEMMSSVDLSWGRKTKYEIKQKEKEIIEAIAKPELEKYGYI